MNRRLTHLEIRPRPSTTIAHGTLACPRCDVPVAPPADGLRPAQWVTCPWCGHDAAARSFLSLGGPVRPARVTVRVASGGR